VGRARDFKFGGQVYHSKCYPSDGNYP